MKRGIVYAAATALALGAAAPVAASVDWLTKDSYVGLTLGTANSDTDAATLQQSITTATTIRSFSLSDSGAAWRLFYGRELSEGLSIEIALVDLGTIDMAIDADTMNVPAHLTQLARLTPVSPGGLTVDLAGEWPVSERLFLTGRVGVFAWETDVSYSDGTAFYRHEDDGIDLHLGAGVGWRVTDNIDARLDYDGYMATTHMTTIAVGVVYRF